MPFLHPVLGTLIGALVVAIFGWWLQRQLLKHEDRAKIRDTIVEFVAKHPTPHVFMRPSDGMHLVDPDQFGTDLISVVIASGGMDWKEYRDYMHDYTEASYRQLLKNIERAGRVSLGNRYSIIVWSCRNPDKTQPGMVPPSIHSPGEFPNNRFHIEDCPESWLYQMRQRSGEAK